MLNKPVVVYSVDSGSGQEVGLQDTPIEVLHLLLTHLLQGKDKFGISREQKEAFLKLLRRGVNRDLFVC